MLLLVKSWKSQASKHFKYGLSLQAFMNLSQAAEQIFHYERQPRINGCALLPFYFILRPGNHPSPAAKLSFLNDLFSSGNCSFEWDP